MSFIERSIKFVGRKGHKNEVCLKTYFIGLISFGNSPPFAGMLSRDAGCMHPVLSIIWWVN